MLTNTFNVRSLLLLSASALVLPFVVSAAHAQTASDVAAPQAAPEAQSGQIGDIVVTAQRRLESAQSVPISLQSFSTAALQNAKVTGTDDLRV